MKKAIKTTFKVFGYIILFWIVVLSVLGFIGAEDIADKGTYLKREPYMEKCLELRINTDLNLLTDTDAVVDDEVIQKYTKICSCYADQLDADMRSGNYNDESLQKLLDAHSRFLALGSLHLVRPTEREAIRAQALACEPKRLDDDSFF